MLIQPSKGMMGIVEHQGEGAVADIEQFRAWSGQRNLRKIKNG